MVTIPSQFHILRSIYSVLYNKNRLILAYFLDAESKGFEPLIPCGMPPFQDGALDHYANSPIRGQSLLNILFSYLSSN